MKIALIGYRGHWGYVLRDLARLPEVEIAAISGGVAVWLWSYAQKHVEPGVLGSFGYLSAICATLFSMIFLKESITPPFIIAFVMILGGMTLIISSGKKEKKAEV